MNRKTRRAMMIAGGMIFLVMLAQFMMSGPEPTAPPQGPAGSDGPKPGTPGGPPAAVEDFLDAVVAKVTIPKQTKIKPEMIDVAKIPASLRHSDAATSVKDVLDHFSLVKIFEKEQILKVRLGESTSADVGLAYVISRGKRAVSIPITTDRAVGGYVNPGMTVDVLGTFRSGTGTLTRRVLSHKKILAINDKHIIEKGGTKSPVKSTEPGKENEPAKDQGFQQIDGIQSVTFELDPQEGEKLLMAAQNTSLSLEIVHPDSADTPIAPVDQTMYTMPPGREPAPGQPGAQPGQPGQPQGPPPVQMVEVIRYKSKEMQAVGLTPLVTSTPPAPGVTGTASAVTPTATPPGAPGQLVPAPAPTPAPASLSPAKAPSPKH
ncbi:MAG: Flp pilus assembly protein CpaB [Candidatus Wallbacteria bacterium]|nr:Flp pilus assembly protein CpaB [Candidatus Wallbacteria bacterium]